MLRSVCVTTSLTWMILPYLKAMLCGFISENTVAQCCVARTKPFHYKIRFSSTMCIEVPPRSPPVALPDRPQPMTSTHNHMRMQRGVSSLPLILCCRKPSPQAGTLNQCNRKPASSRALGRMKPPMGCSSSDNFCRHLHINNF